jgi:hypothetical protein
VLAIFCNRKRSVQELRVWKGRSKSVIWYLKSYLLSFTHFSALDWLRSQNITRRLRSRHLMSCLISF